MKIAVTYENGNVFGHFGQTQQFKIYNIENGAVVSSEIVPTMGSGHGALAGFLKDRGVEALICGGIGGGARVGLNEAGIKIYPGCSGNADKQVADFLSSALEYDPNTECDHHGHNHGEEHGCGSHGCGNH